LVLGQRLPRPEGSSAVVVSAAPERAETNRATTTLALIKLCRPPVVPETTG
jgi:hypothetical protein